MSSSLLIRRISVSRKQQLALQSRNAWSLREIGSRSSRGGDLLISGLDSLPRDIPNPPPLFVFESPRPLPPINTKYTLLVKGSGAGHGVGMSQWGAHGMAQKGADFRRILTHYYKDVAINRYSST